MINHAVEEYVELLADERFKDLDYTVIKSHVSFLKDITLDQLLAAVKKHKVTRAHSLSHVESLCFVFTTNIVISRIKRQRKNTLRRI